VTSVRRAAGPLLLASAALLLSGCGIPATGVVQAGAPGTGIGRPTTVLYFVKGGVPVPVARAVDGPVDVGTAVQTLFLGLDAQDRRRGLATALPQLTAGPTVRTDGTLVRIGLPEGTPQLTATAFQQLACTVDHATIGHDDHAASGAGSGSGLGAGAGATGWVLVVTVPGRQQGGYSAGYGGSSAISPAGCSDPGQ